MQQRHGRRWVHLGVAIGAGALFVGCGSAGALPRIVGSAAGTNEARASADALQSSYLLPNFELAPGVDLPAGEADAWRWPLTDAAAVADLAGRLGVPGTPEQVPPDLGGGWTVGGEDADLNLSVSAGGSWWMGSTRSASSISVCTTPAAPADAPSADGSVVLGEPVCDPLGPPPDLPTDDELLATARTVFGDGVELALTERSDWWVGVSATYLVDGRPSGVTGSYSVGSGGPSAAGVLGTPERIGPYPTISAADALARLTATGGGSPMPLVASVPSDAKAAVSSDGDVAVSSDDPFPGAVGGSDAGAGSGSSSPGYAGEAESPTSEPALPSEPAVPEELQPEPYPVPEPMPLPMPEVVPEVITLVGVQPTLVPFSDVDGVMWALPGYRFADGDGSTWDVVAVSDEFFGVADPTGPGLDEPAPGGVEPPVTAVPEPGVVDPGSPPSTTVVGGSTGGDPIPEAELEALRGLFEEEAYLLLESRASVVRVAVRDGVSLPLTRDYRADRVNLGIADGVVVEWWIG